MPIIRLAVGADVSLFNGNSLTLITLSVLALCGAITVILTRVPVIKEGRDQFSFYLRLLLIILLFTVPAAVDCSVAINSPYPITFFFVVVTIALSSRSHPGSLTLVMTPFSALLASGANATGLLVWPIVLWTAWKARWSKMALLVLFAVGTAYSVLYIATIQSLGNHNSMPAVTKMIDYLLAFLGLPFSRAAVLAIPARLLGAALLAGGVAVLARGLVIKKQGSFSHRFGSALILFTLMTAIAAAVGRADLEEEVKLPVRYALFVAPLHIGLLFVLYPAIVAWAVTPAREIMVRWAAVAFAGVLLGLQVASVPQAITASNRFNAALDAFAAGSRDESLKTLVFPNLDFAAQVQRQLAAY